MPDEKGKFDADIGQDLIDAAVQSVEKRTGGADGSTPAAASAVAETAPQDSRDKEIASLKAQLELSLGKGRETFDKLKEEHERALRAAADLDNLRKRALKEKEEAQKFGTEKLLRDFLTVIDNLDRALEHAKGSTDFASLQKGVEMTRKLFEDTLAKHGVKGFAALGKPFDPRLHEAMQHVETNDVPPNQVVIELVRGYLLHDRLIRPALVGVSKAPAPAPAPAQPAGGEQPNGGTAGDPAPPDAGS